MSEQIPECSICYIPMNQQHERVKLHNCKHMYHIYCIKEWIKLKPSCPLCRDTVSNIDYHYMNVEYPKHIVTYY